MASSTIPEMDSFSVQNLLVPHPVFSHTVKWSWLPWVQLSLHRCWAVLGHTQDHLQQQRQSSDIISSGVFI